MEVAVGGSGLGVGASVGEMGVTLGSGVGVDGEEAGPQLHTRESERIIMIMSEASFFIVCFPFLGLYAAHLLSFHPSSIDAH